MPNGQHERAHQGWHMDKRVPVALLVALAAQAGGFGYWAASIDSRAAHNAARIEMLERSRGDDNFEHRVTRVEVTLDGIQTTLRRIERKLDGESGWAQPGGSP